MSHHSFLVLYVTLVSLNMKNRDIINFAGRNIRLGLYSWVLIPAYVVVWYQHTTITLILTMHNLTPITFHWLWWTIMVSAVDLTMMKSGWNERSCLIVCQLCNFKICQRTKIERVTDIFKLFGHNGDIRKYPFRWWDIM